jgi:hypothetical protein
VPSVAVRPKDTSELDGSSVLHVTVARPCPSGVAVTWVIAGALVSAA